jgi:hypothetical protein
VVKPSRPKGQTRQAGNVSLNGQLTAGHPGRLGPGRLERKDDRLGGGGLEVAAER